MYPLNDNIYSDKPDAEPTRAGFGCGLKSAGQADEKVVGLCADLVESVKMDGFANEFPSRYIEVGIAEQKFSNGRRRTGARRQNSVCSQLCCI